jgi:hypothetical protein
MADHNLIHATFKDGTTMLFRPNEWVWVADWWDNEYFSGDKRGRACMVIKPGVYVVEKFGERCSETKIVRVRRV